MNDRGADGALTLGAGRLIVTDRLRAAMLSRILGATLVSIRTPPPDGNPPLDLGLTDGALRIGLDTLGADLPLNPTGGDERICTCGADLGAEGAADLMLDSLDLPPRFFDWACAVRPVSRARAVARATIAPLLIINFFSVVNICSLPFFPRRHPSTATIRDQRCRWTQSNRLYLCKYDSGPQP